MNFPRLVQDDVLGMDASELELAVVRMLSHGDDYATVDVTLDLIFGGARIVLAQLRERWRAKSDAHLVAIALRLGLIE